METTINIRRKDISDDTGAETTIKLAKKMENPELKSTLDMIEEYQDVGERREAGIRRMYSQLKKLEETSQEILEHPVIQKRQKEDETPEDTLERLINHADKMMG